MIFHGHLGHERDEYNPTCNSDMDVNYQVQNKDVNISLHGNARLVQLTRCYEYSGESQVQLCCRRWSTSQCFTYEFFYRLYDMCSLQSIDVHVFVRLASSDIKNDKPRTKNRTIWITLRKHQSDTLGLDRCLIDVDSRVFAIRGCQFD